ncbi:hypothetical protein AB205_0044900, partial [Aquarana catesbeiana]
KIQCSRSTISHTVQAVYTVSNTVCTVSTTFLVVYTVSNTVCTVSTTLLVVYTIQCSCSTVSNTVQVVYTVSNTVCTVLLHFWRCTQYLEQCVQFLIHFRWCAQYLIQCSVVLQNKKYIMSGRPPRRGRCSQATKRGQAASVSTVNSDGRGHGASSAGGRGARLPFFSAAGCFIEPQHAEELVEWITKPSSSPSSFVTQAQSSLPSNTAAKVAYSTGSLSTVTPSIAPPSCTEESPELFHHCVGYMFLEDAQ